MQQTGHSKLVYWEQQGQDQLCGVHCANSLLQGPFFNEIELAALARELDEQENMLIQTGSLNEDQLQKQQQRQSNNVADDGNFSIQVLQAALKKMGDLIFESVDSKINKNQDLSSELGFICNSDHHWFAIRNVNGIWYNLNSTNKTGPQIISDFYLSAFLMSVKENGYNIFLIRGTMPISSKEVNLNEMILWNVMNQIIKDVPSNSEVSEVVYSRRTSKQIGNRCSFVNELHQQNLKDKNYKLNIGGSDEQDYDRAIKESMEMYNKQNEKHAEEEEEDDEDNPPKKEDENAFKPFQGEGISMGVSSNQGESNQIDEYFAQFVNKEDPELAFVIKMSLQQPHFLICSIYKKFEVKLSEGITLQFRFPDGTKLNWTFDPHSSVRDLYDFVRSSQKENNEYNFIICQNFPKKEFTNLDLSFEATGIVNMTSLIITQRN